jgi:outer membrane protein TolC
MLTTFSRRNWAVLPAVCAGLLMGAGCTSKYYRKSADKEVYGIIQNFENRLFGRTNEFGINTRYSSRAPKEIPPAEIIDDRSATNRRIINLADALDLAVANSREYQAQKEQLYLTALTLTGQRYEFSPQFFAESTAQITGTPEGLDIGSVNSRIGVSQLLRTGGRLTASLGNDLIRYFMVHGSGDNRNTVINTLSVDLTQPILRGFGVNSPQVESLTQAERNTVYAIRSFSEYQKDFSVEIVTRYFALLTQKDIVRNNYRNYTNRVETTQYLEARAVDRERQSQVDDARNSELGARRDYINSLAAYLNSLDSFKLTLGVPVSERIYLDDADLRELVDAGLIPVEVNPKVAFAITLTNQLEILNAIDRYEDSKRKVRVAADQLKPGLGLFASGRISSEEPDDYVNFDFDNLHYTAGVTLDLPVDRLRERNTYRATLVSFESQLRSLALTLDNYRDRVDRGLRTIEQSRLNYLNGVESLRVAERRVDNNTMLMEAGRATIRDLREAQDILIQAQNTLSTLYTVYLSSRLELLLNMGVIDVRPDKFWLADPLATRLSPTDRGAPPLRMPDDQVLPPETFIEPAT